MAQIKCPNGHFYNNAIYNRCPYCSEDAVNPAPTPPPPPPEPPSNSKSKMPWIVTGMAALMAVFCFVRTSDAQKELALVEQSVFETNRQTDDAADKLSEISKRLDDQSGSTKIAAQMIELMRRTYGRASDSFYASSPMIILKAGGKARKLNVYFNPNGKSGSAKCATLDRAVDARCLNRWSRDIDVNWSGDAWNDHKKDIIITPGKTRGYNIIHFFNDVTNDSFDVLVVVK